MYVELFPISDFSAYEIVFTYFIEFKERIK